MAHGRACPRGRPPPRRLEFTAPTPPFRSQRWPRGACGVRSDPAAPDAATACARASKWALIGVALWIVVGIIFSAEYLIVTRDPGFLTSHRHLAHRSRLVRHPYTWRSPGRRPAAPTSFPTLGRRGTCMGTSSNRQGARALPALISVGGWIAGMPGVLAANVVVGGVGVLAVYNLARRFLTPLAALAPAAALALTVSHLGLSRSAYYRAAHARPRDGGDPLGVAWARTRPPVGTDCCGCRIGRDGARAHRWWCLCAGCAGRAWPSRPPSTGTAARRRADRRSAWRKRVFVAAGYASLARWSYAYLDRLGDEARLLGVAYAVVALAVMLWSATWSTGAGTTLARA